jgi:hypothetical protein
MSRNGHREGLGWREFRKEEFGRKEFGMWNVECGIREEGIGREGIGQMSQAKAAGIALGTIVGGVGGATWLGGRGLEAVGDKWVDRPRELRGTGICVGAQKVGNAMMAAGAAIAGWCAAFVP